MTDVAAALTASWQACWWLLDDPDQPDRWGMALRSFEAREVREHVAVEVSDRAASRGSRLVSGGGGGPGYADPVGSTVVGPVAEVLDERRHELVGLEVDIARRAGAVRQATSRILYDSVLELGSLTLRQAAAEIVWCSTAPHTTKAALHHLRVSWSPPLVVAWPALAAEVDELWHCCQRLQRMVLTQLEQATSLPVRPPQPRLKGCESCARDGGAFEPLRMDRHGKVLDQRFCRWCGDWRRTHGRMPPLGVVVARRQGRKVTSRVIAEALAAEQRGATPWRS